MSSRQYVTVMNCEIIIINKYQAFLQFWFVIDKICYENSFVGSKFDHVIILYNQKLIFGIQKCLKKFFPRFKNRIKKTIIYINEAEAQLSYHQVNW